MLHMRGIPIGVDWSWFFVLFLVIWLLSGYYRDLLGGPERVETGWWDGEEVQRDYYQAVDARGSRLWIFRERLAPHRWFLHGVFS